MQKTTFELSTFQEYIWMEGIHLYCAKLQKHLLLQHQHSCGTCHFTFERGIERSCVLELKCIINVEITPFVVDINVYKRTHF